MVTETKQTAPYAPVHNVLSVIRRLRDRGLPDPLTLEELTRIGIPEGNAPRTLAALRFLNLVNDEGWRTQSLDRLGQASTDEYPEALAEIVREAYAPVFTVVDPAEDSEIALNDAFRHYQPQAQRGRMVTLFLGLCREAGIIPGGPPRRKTKVRKTATERPGPRPVKQTAQTPIEATAEAQLAAIPAETGVDYRLVSALMQQLPKDGKWTHAKRDKWVEAVSASIDFLTNIVEEEDSGDQKARDASLRDLKDIAR